jgi:hypothetical protein
MQSFTTPAIADTKAATVRKLVGRERGLQDEKGQARPATDEEVGERLYLFLQELTRAQQDQLDSLAAEASKPANII